MNNHMQDLAFTSAGDFMDAPNRFIAAMDHSGGSTGGVLERYNQEFTEENKMDLVHEMRLRMYNSPHFNSNNIWAAILYKDTVERGMVPLLKKKGIEAFLKIDSGCTEDGMLHDFDIVEMLDLALYNDCIGTKMRSIVKTDTIMKPIIRQQITLANIIIERGLLPIVEPEVPIDHQDKNDIENALLDYLKEKLDDLNGQCILKLTIPTMQNLYYELTYHPNVYKVVGLSGGYTTAEACSRLSLNTNMTASFSRALSEKLYAGQSDSQFNAQMKDNIRMIKSACQ